MGLYLTLCRKKLVSLEEEFLLILLTLGDNQKGRDSIEDCTTCN